MEIFVIIGILLLLYAYVKHPEIVRVDRETVLHFGSLIFIINVVKMAAILTVGSSLFPSFVQGMREAMSHIPSVNYLLAAYWEDTFYVLPYLLLSKLIFNIESKKLKISLFVGLFLLFLTTTLHFASGHLYQGKMGWLTVIYPITSYCIAGRKGLGTMLILHVIFDFSAYIGFLLGVFLSGAL